MADNDLNLLGGRRAYSGNGAYVLAGLFAAAAVGAFFADFWIADFFFRNQNRLPGDLDKMINLSEVMGHGTGILAILLVIVVLDRATWCKLPRLVVCFYVPGLVVTVLKRVIGRARPSTFVDGDSGVGQFPDSVWETFDVSGSSQSFQSFPSGHATMAVAAAITLSWLYPRGRWLFACYAALAAMQRMYVGAHYLSDVCAGAAIACLLTGFCLDRRVLGRYFERFESRAAENVAS